MRPIIDRLFSVPSSPAIRIRFLRGPAISLNPRLAAGHVRTARRGHVRIKTMERAKKARLAFISESLRAGNSWAGRSMKGRKAGQISAKMQRKLGWPNLERAWQARRESRPLARAEKQLEQNRAEQEAAIARWWGISVAAIELTLANPDGLWTPWFIKLAVSKIRPNHSGQAFCEPQPSSLTPNPRHRIRVDCANTSNKIKQFSAPDGRKRSPCILFYTALTCQFAWQLAVLNGQHEILQMRDSKILLLPRPIGGFLRRSASGLD